LNVWLFVYGTLAPGRDAWPVLERWVVGEPQADSVAGRLYDTGRGYPAATFRATGAGVVHGTVVTLDPDRTDRALAALDRYEGNEYERITVRTRNGLDAATYAWIAPLSGCRPVDDGRWNEGPQT
jgi:gamma-glutamylcyclotransferase (GGCT)/AIG2-like uncharacterized protein YtfP